MKTISIKWLQALNTDEVDETIEEACVDCYGEDEQCSALADMAAEELVFPFPAKVMGEAVEAVDSAPSKYDPLGLNLVVVHKGKQYAIAAHCVELVKPLPGGHLYLAALPRFEDHCPSAVAVSEALGFSWVELPNGEYYRPKDATLESVAKFAVGCVRLA